MSTETKFMPGPWRYLEDHDGDAAGRPLTIIDADNNDLAEVFSAHDSTVPTTREQAIANARLMAASPQLFAVAQLIVDAFLFAYPEAAGKSDMWLYDTLGSALSHAFIAARAAIVKVTG